MWARFWVLVAQACQSLQGMVYACNHLLPTEFKRHFDEVARIFYYASSLSFYTILSLSPVLLFIALIFVSPFSKAFEIETLFFPNSPDFIQMSQFFLKSFMRNNRTLGIVEMSFIALAFFLFCENYRYIASQILNAPPRDYITIKGKRFFIFWGFGTGIVFVIVLPAIVFINIQMHHLTQNTYWLAFLRWLVVYGFFVLLFLIPTNKVFRHTFYPLFWSFITSVCWSIMKWGFVYYILYNRTYHELYGSVSILWFLMSYIYISWLLLLLGLYGCEVCEQKG
ncbi:YihY family inner membrane protein [Helicobacter baculiformis]|uniref:YihY family inner membrane protein n=1 Tax=Helicobacter baculiformis TaxID=427351 RepID=A0ABV7ZGU1_9HELI|nr:YihY family inner membrane protein [Helicobacter baculiformis]